MRSSFWNGFASESILFLVPMAVVYVLPYAGQGFIDFPIRCIGMFPDVGIEFADDVPHVRFFLFGKVLFLFRFFMMAVGLDDVAFGHEGRIVGIEEDVFVFGIEVRKEYADVDGEVLEGVLEIVHGGFLPILKVVGRLDADVEVIGGLFHAVVDDERGRSEELQVVAIDAIDFRQSFVDALCIVDRVVGVCAQERDNDHLDTFRSRIDVDEHFHVLVGHAVDLEDLEKLRRLFLDFIF